MYTIGPGIWRENLPKSKIRDSHGRTWNMARNTEKHEKSKLYTVGPGIWRKRLKNVQNEKHVLQDLDCGEKIEKLGNVTHTVGPGICREF